LKELVLVPSDGGRFEVYVDGKLIHSKLKTGKFPDSREILKAIESRG
jgi:selenoprotein W-related protein